MAWKECVESCKEPAKRSPGPSAALAISTYVWPPRCYLTPFQRLQFTQAEVDPNMQGQRFSSVLASR